MNPLLAFAACFAERIKVNATRSELRDGRRIFLKQRRRSAWIILHTANRFFRLAGNPVRALVELPEWQSWEIECFRRLHGTEFEFSALDPRTLIAEELPGQSLAHFLDTKSLTIAMAAAAGRELRRCHETHGELWNGAWSHGDPHAGNFLYASEEDRARLIDFELVHDRSLSAEDRHADDLLVFLQDVVGRVSRTEWLALARAFLDAYDRPAIVARLRARLVLPLGIPRLWWAVRTTYLPGSELAHRLELLREAISESGVTATR